MLLLCVQLRLRSLLDWKLQCSRWVWEANTKPSLLRITTPTLALFSSKNIAPSKLILRKLGGGGFCQVRGRISGGLGGGWTDQNSYNRSLANWASKWREKLGWWSWTWFCWFQIDHTFNAKSSGDFCCWMIHAWVIWSPWTKLFLKNSIIQSPTRLYQFLDRTTKHESPILRNHDSIHTWDP